MYEATDSKLGRSVAIKLLPEAFTHDTDRAARFEREVRVLASLNHPNIAAIHGIEESGGRKFLVMELVPGETLAERIRRGRIPVHEALEIAKQITEALEAAHDSEKAIIHCDLKPANVKVTPDGKVKVLDFGLAKALSGEPAAEDISNSPTLSMAATRQGVILGTAAYMSPEQARGKIVDRRTDIWAFGAVLYEMLTAKQAFRGEDVTNILAAVVKSEPALEALPTKTPPAIRNLVRRCLEKNPQRRLMHIGEARVLIEDVLSGAAPVEPVTAGQGKSRERVAWSAAGVLLVGFVVALFWGASAYFRPAPQATQAIRFFISPPDTWNFQSLTNATGVSPVPIAVSTAGGGQPRWRRDGTEIFYLAPDNKLMAAAVNGRGPSFEVGVVKLLFETRGTGPRYQYAVNPDGQRFLINTASEQAASTPISVVVNWTAGLKR